MKFSTAHDGGEIATLRDQDGRTIVVDAADYRRLLALGFTGRWFTNEVTTGYRYVRVSRDPRETGGQALFTVSRLILGAGERQSVRHRDGNRLNLRRRNLALRGGKGGAGAQAALQKAQEGRADAR
ncbi:hypothetical protein [Roseicella aerolata]|uniref:HNH endonuclease n=1 Tax=Roseicella aerolata TaxID=2883479 RepID=A0A9X1IDS1_9PROT|nr:hypothetical protein [Roseicella aerolata]MCB4822627.1 hypothetical protein [Roseicella aerolata]